MDKVGNEMQSDEIKHDSRAEGKEVNEFVKNIV